MHEIIAYYSLTKTIIMAALIMYEGKLAYVYRNGRALFNHICLSKNQKYRYKNRTYEYIPYYYRDRNGYL